MTNETCGTKFTYFGQPVVCALPVGHIGSTNGEHDDRVPECGAKFTHEGRTATTYFFCNKAAGHATELHVAPDGKGGTVAW